jgi:hypothetical protein
MLVSNKISIVALHYFYCQGHDEQIGYIGLVTQLATVIAGLILSRILDYTKAY